MVEISLEQAEQLARIRALRPSRPLNLQGYDSEKYLFLHNIFKYASDEEAVPLLDAPEEWLKEIYLDAFLYGPHFRDIKNMFTTLENMNSNDDRIAQFEGQFNLGYHNRLRFHASAELLAGSSLRKPTVLAISRGYKQFEEKFRSDSDTPIMVYMIAAALTVRDLIYPADVNAVSNRFDTGQYSYLVQPWRKVFGELTKVDEDKNFPLFSLSDYDRRTE